MKRLLVTNMYNLYNKGECYHIAAIRIAFPDYEITVDGLYSFYNQALCNQLRLNWLGQKHHSNIIEILLELMQRMINPPNYDLVIDLGGDTFSERPMVRYAVAHALVLLPFALHKRKYVVVSQSIGRFSITKPLCKFVLSRAKGVVVRDYKSYDYLHSIGIECYLGQDLAYGVLA